jgi:hypothetical protein
MIVCELLSGRVSFPDEMRACRIQGEMLVGEVRSEIPDFVFPAGRVQIAKGEAHDADDRPMFDELVERLSEMQFKVIGDVA